VTSFYGPGIEIAFSCSVCPAIDEVRVEEFAALRFLPPPVGWLWVADRGFCPACRHYANVYEGGDPLNDFWRGDALRDGSVAIWTAPFLSPCLNLVTAALERRAG
jgi:hypothetical protein